MFTYTLRRLVFTLPLLFVISLIVFLLIDLAPNDPTANIPLSVPPELREQLRTSLGLDAPAHVRYALWCKQFFIVEPLNLFETWLGWDTGADTRLRLRSWSMHVPVVDLIAQRLPQTLWVVGMSMVIGVLIALPLGAYSAYRQGGWVDQIGGLIAMLGFSVPSFFLGVLMILVFSVGLGWLPANYDTSHKVTDWHSLIVQIQQMILPVAVLALYNAALFSRYLRVSMLEHLKQDYVRTARAKGLKETRVITRHVLRNALIPVLTVVSLSVPQVFAGAVVTEQVFRVNGLGHLLIQGIQNADVPLVQSLSFLFAVLIVLFNLLADIAYGILDPRIRYD